MKAIKVTGVVLLVLILLIGGLIFYALSNLDTLVQTGVERFGSDVTKTDVTLANVDIDLQSGRAQLSELVVSNPEGYDSEYAFALNDIIVQIQPGSVGRGEDDIVVIEEITVDGASIIGELQGLRNSNLQELSANVRDSLPAADPEQRDDEPAGEYVGPKFRVERFVFSNANLSLISEQLGDRRLDMPTVTATDLGGETGLPPQELAAALMDQVLAQAIATVRNEVEDAAERELRNELQDRARDNLDDEDRKRLENLRDRLNR